MELTLLPVELIIAKNSDFTNIPVDAESLQAVEACYSSYAYYDVIYEQIASKEYVELLFPAADRKILN